MPVTESQITDEMVNTAVRGGRNTERLAALLNLPSVRQLVLAAIRTEHDDMIAALPGWCDMSDVDRGAVLMHLHKVENEGDEYARENYPAKFIDAPRLTGLGSNDACTHAQRFEDVSEELLEENGDEWERLYNLALDHERSN